MQIDGQRRVRRSRAVFLCAALSFGSARGEALEHVAADAPAVLWINHLAPPAPTTHPATHPTTALAGNQDPIAATERAMGVRSAGLDPNRDVAIYLPNRVEGTDPSPVVLLLPVADYAAFLAAQPDGSTDAGVTAIRPSGDAADVFVARRGSYVAISRSRDSLASGHAGVRIAPEDLAQMNCGDVAIYVKGTATTGVLAVGARPCWLSPGNSGGRPAVADLPLGHSELDREIGAADQLWRAVGWQRDATDLRYRFGLLCRSQLDYGNAMEQFQKVVALRPDDADSHVALAAVLAETHQFGAAAAHLQEAVRLDPKNFDAFHDAGLILLQLGADRRAAVMLGHAVELRPRSAATHSDFGVALVRLRRYAEATLEFRAALAIDPTLQAAATNLNVARRLAAKQHAATTRASR